MSLSDYFSSIAPRLGIPSLLLLSAEADLGNTIRDIPMDKFPLLLLLIPSGDSVAPTPDSITEVSTCLLYLIQKVDATDQTHASFLEVMASTQSLMAQIKTLMATDKGDHSLNPHLTHGINLHAMHTDPEYNFFGCHGWSLSFTITNTGF